MAIKSSPKGIPPPIVIVGQRVIRVLFHHTFPIRLMLFVVHQMVEVSSIQDGLNLGIGSKVVLVLNHNPFLVCLFWVPFKHIKMLLSLESRVQNREVEWMATLPIQLVDHHHFLLSTLVVEFSAVRNPMLKDVFACFHASHFLWHS